MRITVLAENTTQDNRLTAEHGLSLYIEANGRRIIFDFGQTEAFADNAATLGIDLSTVDLGILSHGHYDHSGGLHRFLVDNQAAPVYISEHAFGLHYHGTEKYIGMDPALCDHPRLFRTGGHTALGNGLTLLDASACATAYPADAYGLTVRTSGGFLPDPFLHEQCLLIETADNRILVSGCSHRGVLNWIGGVHPDIFIGGFHFMKLDPATDGDTLAQAGRILEESGCLFLTGHCTGDAAFAYLKSILKGRLLPLSTGLNYTLP